MVLKLVIHESDDGCRITEAQNRSYAWQSPNAYRTEITLWQGASY